MEIYRNASGGQNGIFGAIPRENFLVEIKKNPGGNPKQFRYLWRNYWLHPRRCLKRKPWGKSMQGSLDEFLEDLGFFFREICGSIFGGMIKNMYGGMK